MKISEVFYQNNLRTKAIHIASGNEIITDAPTDNNGKGEAFSPTDLVATALASCMLTIMGIFAQKHKIDITGAKATIHKIMGSNPRRIKEIIIEISLNKKINSKNRKLLKKAALLCPVGKSLEQDIIQNIRFNYV